MKPDYIKNITNGERRTITTPVELRAEGEAQYFEGYAVIFNSITDLGYFTEEIDSRAFDDVMDNDVRGLFNHDPDVVLGRTKSGTMAVAKDKTGIKYKIQYNAADPDHVRVMEKIKRGDVSQSSFAFSVAEQEWKEKKTDNGTEYHRIIRKIEQWYDVAPVTYPAYADTTVAARSLESAKNEAPPAQPEPQPEPHQDNLDTQVRKLRTQSNQKLFKQNTK